MREKIIIDNFCGIKHYVIELKSINVFIGENGVGKSVTAKLVYFFKSIYMEIWRAYGIHNSSLQTFDNLERVPIPMFKKFFPFANEQKDFRIEYKVNNHAVIIEQLIDSDIRIVFPDTFKALLDLFKRENKKSTNEAVTFPAFDKSDFESEYREILEEVLGKVVSPVYIPAGRSFYANFKANLFSFINEGTELDPFLIKFGELYESAKSVVHSRSDESKVLDVYFKKLLKGRFTRNAAREDFIINASGLKTKLAYSASGQQEVLPILIFLRMFFILKTELDNICLIIEEPEAHLFPEAQKILVEFISFVYNQHPGKFQFILTTHSPYILASFNNLIEANTMYSETEDSKVKKKIARIISTDLHVDHKHIQAYALDFKKSKSLKDKETKLLGQNMLDKVSESIAIELEQLMAIES